MHEEKGYAFTAKPMLVSSNTLMPMHAGRILKSNFNELSQKQ